jgi:hypothetical protein
MIEWKGIQYGDDNLDKIDDDNKVMDEEVRKKLQGLSGTSHRGAGAAGWPGRGK